MDDKQKNEKNKEEEKNQVVEDPEEIKKLLDELKEMDPSIKQLMDSLPENSEIKGIKIIKTKDQKIKDKLLKILLDVILNVFLMLGISGLIKWYEGTIGNIILFSLLYTLLETMLNYIIITFIPKIKLFSFGLSDVICTVVGFLLSLLIVHKVISFDTTLVIVFFLIFLVVKALIKFLIMKYAITRQFKKRR